jgi:hypothetical protein
MGVDGLEWLRTKVTGKAARDVELGAHLDGLSVGLRRVADEVTVSFQLGGEGAVQAIS